MDSTVYETVVTALCHVKSWAIHPHCCPDKPETNTDKITAD